MKDRVRIRRDVFLQEYECRNCQVEVTMGSTVLTARPITGDWRIAHEWLDRATRRLLALPARFSR